MEIKNCPKCGGKASLTCESLVDFVRCEECGHEGHSFYDMVELAIKSWNLEAVGRNWCPWKCRANEKEWEKYEE